MAETLFDIEAERPKTHACTGPSCHFCEWLDGHEAKDAGTDAANIDPRWALEAGAWRRTLVDGDLFTADDLIAAIGLPDGHPNQIGALFRLWHKAATIRPRGHSPSTRASNHARMIQVWQVRRGL
jgi:hypothetical protein